MSEQRLEGFAKVKAATPFNASEQERHDTLHKNYYRELFLFIFSEPPAGAARTAVAFGGKSDAKPPHASFTNNLYAST